MTSDGDKVAVHLFINSGETKLAAIITVDLDQTAGSLLDQVAERVGFDPDYIVLYLRGENSMKIKDGSMTVESNFKASNRIGCSSMCDNQAEMNSVKLRDYNIRMNSVITCLIRPMRGDHIHQAIAIYVHGELVDTLWDQDFLRTPNANEGNTYPVTFSDLSFGMLIIISLKRIHISGFTQVKLTGLVTVSFMFIPVHLGGGSFIQLEREQFLTCLWSRWVLQSMAGNQFGTQWGPSTSQGRHTESFLL